ncbi:gluconate 2-dehydrogenase subunit 3 family protein [Rhodobacteraceae bacterium NNCM2]|nr:gluconate 2-dehydrogenase subunit 3 family protein [Coraliihabitans acroporae]
METGDSPVARIDRRQLCLTAFLFSLPGAAALAAVERTSDLETRLISYADTILPADETPSASQLGSHARILARAEGDERFRQILVFGLDTLDEICRRSSGRPMTDTSDEYRHLAVAEISRRPPSDLVGWFFAATRAELFFDYYARPESWPGLGIDAPPQPVGYPDHAAPMAEPQ